MCCSAQKLPQKPPVLQYVKWAGLTDTDAFYTSDRVKTLYKNHIKALTSHVNKINNIAFKDDPTIFAWGQLPSSSKTHQELLCCTKRTSRETPRQKLYLLPLGV